MDGGRFMQRANKGGDRSAQALTGLLGKVLAPILWTKGPPGVFSSPMRPGLANRVHIELPTEGQVPWRLADAKGWTCNSVRGHTVLIVARFGPRAVGCVLWERGGSASGGECAGKLTQRRY